MVGIEHNNKLNIEYLGGSLKSYVVTVCALLHHPLLPSPESNIIFDDTDA